jgi:hypothetical protein
LKEQKNKFVEETKPEFNSGKKFVVNGKRCANIAWCGRGDGGMIFNTNDLEVAPPHTLVLEILRSKGVCAKNKLP